MFVPSIFFAFAVFVVLPLLLVLMVGWRFGKQVAFRTLSWRGAATALAILGFIPFLFWYLLLVIPAGGGKGLPARDFAGSMRVYWNALIFFAIPAGMAAGISLALNLDQYPKRGRRGKDE